MRIHNLYVDDQGETHFRDIEVEWAEEGPGGKMSRKIPATGLISMVPDAYLALFLVILVALRRDGEKAPPADRRGLRYGA